MNNGGLTLAGAGANGGNVVNNYINHNNISVPSTADLGNALKSVEYQEGASS